MNTNNGKNPKIKAKFEALFTKRDNTKDVNFEAQMLAFTFLNEIEKLMEKNNTSKKDLAEMISTSPSYITQLFRGNKLPNLKTIAAMGLALNKKFNVNATESIEQSRKSYSDYIQGEVFDANLLSNDSLKFKMNDNIKPNKHKNLKICVNPINKEYYFAPCG